MKKLIFILILQLALLGCEKEEELAPNFIEGKFVYTEGNIFTKNLNWTNRKKLTSDAVWSQGADFFYVMQQWSFDGSQILYLRTARDNTNSIMIMDSSGDNKKQIIEFYGRTRAMDWSNDGQWIAYTRIRDNGGIHIISVNGEENKIINIESESQIASLSFSQDSKKIAIHKNSNEIVILDIDSEEELYKIERNGIDGKPHWSPNDEFIVYSTLAPPNGSIVLLNVNDNSEKIIVQDFGHIDLFGWTPDGEYIIYSSPAGEKYGNFQAMQVSTGQETELNYKSDGWLDYPKGDLFIFD